MKYYIYDKYPQNKNKQQNETNQTNYLGRSHYRTRPNLRPQRTRTIQYRHFL